MVNPNRYYTYAYLRKDGTPYYIGKGNGSRAYSKIHNVIVPPKEQILFLKQNLTEEAAFRHEIYMIAVFGRKDLGTGILRNRSDGGDSPPKQYKNLYTPYERTVEIRAKQSKSAHKMGRPGKQTLEEIERKRQSMKKVWEEGKRKKLSRDTNGRFVKKMNIQTSNDNTNIEWNLEEMKTAYKEAAESDRFLFGDFDYSYVWKEIETNDVY